MFPTLGLLAAVRCPDISAGGPGCHRSPCLFSHVLRADVAAATASIIKRDLANSDGVADDAPAPKRPRALFTNGQPTSPSSSSGTAAANVGRSKPSNGVAASPVGLLASRAATASSSTRRLGPLKSGSDAYVRSLLQARERQAAGIGSASASKKAAFAATIDGTSHSKITASTTADKGKAKQNAGKFSSNTPIPPSQSLTSAEPPRVSVTVVKTYVPLLTRNSMLKSIHKEYLQLYGALQPRTRGLNLASQHALAEEAAVYAKNNQHSYRNAGISVIARLKRRDPALNTSQVGTLSEIERQASATTAANNDDKVLAGLRKLALTRQQMIAHAFIVDMPSGVGSSQLTCEGETKSCDRCNNTYIVRSYPAPAERQSCSYHWGRITSAGGNAGRLWSCCQAIMGSSGCTVGPHIFRDVTPEDLHIRAAFVRTSSLRSSDAAVPLKIAALDCEMCATTAGSSVVRVTVMDHCGTVVVDEILRPTADIVDYLTRYSGIREHDLSRATMTLEEFHAQMLGDFIDERTIIIGHSLESDLAALRLLPRAGTIIDTTALYPHPRGLPYRLALRALAKDHLKRFIQDSGSSGHSSEVDAQAALDLALLKAADSFRDQ